MPRLVLLTVFLVVTASCNYGGDEGGGSDAGATGSLQPGTVLIDTGDDTVLVDVEVAQDPEERARGLMFRRSLPDDAGMVFIYFQPHDGGFWMKNTRIPLSIAFFGKQGRILRILDMEPCRRDPCPMYEPKVSFWGALEVNRGAFDAWGVEVGDTIRLTQ
jgi:uncharacterized membrane protein (UPF0127 family)